MTEQEAMINYETLLKKYMAHVVDVEGSDFLYAVKTDMEEVGYSEQAFTKEEIAELQRLRPINQGD